MSAPVVLFANQSDLTNFTKYKTCDVLYESDIMVIPIVDKTDNMLIECDICFK